MRLTMLFFLGGGGETNYKVQYIHEITGPAAKGNYHFLDKA